MVLDNRHFLPETVFQNVPSSEKARGPLLQSAGPNCDKTYVCVYILSD